MNREVLTGARVEAELQRLSALLEKRTEEFAGFAQEAARTEAVHKAAFAKALLLADGNMTVREARATLRCHKLYLARKAAEATKDSCRESLNSLRTQLSMLQTISANIRAQT